MDGSIGEIEGDNSAVNAWQAHRRNTVVGTPSGMVVLEETPHDAEGSQAGWQSGRNSLFDQGYLKADDAASSSFDTNIIVESQQSMNLNVYQGGKIVPQVPTF